MKKNSIIATATLIIALISGYIWLKKYQSNSLCAHTNELIVGTAAGYAPFASINPQGDLEGFDIDIAHAVADRMSKNLVIKDLGSMASLFTALDQGTIDVIIWGL